MSDPWKEVHAITGHGYPDSCPCDCKTCIGVLRLVCERDEVRGMADATMAAAETAAKQATAALEQRDRARREALEEAAAFVASCTVLMENPYRITTTAALAADLRAMATKAKP